MPLGLDSLKTPVEEPKSEPDAGSGDVSAESKQPAKKAEPKAKKRTPAKKAEPKAKKRTPAKKAEPSVYVAITSGVAEYKGETATFTKGVTRVAEGHWLLKRVKDAFEPVQDHVHYGLENAEGEKRS